MKNKTLKLFIFSFMVGSFMVSCKPQKKTCAAYSKANTTTSVKDKSI